MGKALRRVALAVVLGTAAIAPSQVASGQTKGGPQVRVLNTAALDGLGSGSTIGPDGALYVSNGTDGTVLRINPNNGAAQVVGTGLPPQIIGLGGAMDVAFLRGQLYALVSLAGDDVGGSMEMGIYKRGSGGTFTLFADIGEFASTTPPPDADFFLSQGVQYSMDVWRDGFLVTDAHHGRVYRVNKNGNVSLFHTFDSTDAVPTGLAVDGSDVYVASAGPIPHAPGTSKVLEIERGNVQVSGGWPASYAGNVGLIVDVEDGSHGNLYGLLQGHWDLPPTPDNEGFPAAPNTGEIVVLDRGKFRTVVSGLNQPTSVDFSGNTAFVVTLGGTILRIDRM